jgi:hypothetical protein
MKARLLNPVVRKAETVNALPGPMLNRTESRNGPLSPAFPNGTDAGADCTPRSITAACPGALPATTAQTIAEVSKVIRMMPSQPFRIVIDSCRCGKLLRQPRSGFLTPLAEAGLHRTA